MGVVSGKVCENFPGYFFFVHLYRKLLKIKDVDEFCRSLFFTLSGASVFF